MSNGAPSRSGSPLETFTREWLDLASRQLGLGFAYEISPMGRSIRVILKALEGARFGDRRWVQVASAVQTLLETAVARQGLPVSALEVQIQEAAAEGPSGISGLVASVRAAAETAVKHGRAFAIGPMSVADRRQIHQALSDLPQVWTQSEGEGIFRRLWIIPRQLLPSRAPPKPAPHPTPTDPAPEPVALPPEAPTPSDT